MEKLGNDTSLLLAAVEPIERVLTKARAKKMLVIHTREGHRPDLSDCPPAKRPAAAIHSSALIAPWAGSWCAVRRATTSSTNFIPIAGEPIIDKPGKGSFHATDLHQILLDRGIKTLIVCGVTLEVCVHTTVREANDRGYECVVLSDPRRVLLSRVPACGPRDEFKAQGAIFGWVSNAKNFIAAIA